MTFLLINLLALTSHKYDASQWVGLGAKRLQLILTTLQTQLCRERAPCTLLGQLTAANRKLLIAACDYRLSDHVTVNHSGPVIMNPTPPSETPKGRRRTKMPPLSGWVLVLSSCNYTYHIANTAVPRTHALHTPRIGNNG